LNPRKRKKGGKGGERLSVISRGEKEEKGLDGTVRKGGEQRVQTPLGKEKGGEKKGNHLFLSARSGGQGAKKRGGLGTPVLLTKEKAITPPCNAGKAKGEKAR